MSGKRGDFSGDSRFVFVSFLALVVGFLCSWTAVALLKLINLFTNLFFFQRFSVDNVSPAANALGIAVILVPTLGGLLIGVMARYGSEKIRGHGIPEALEAILFGKSIMDPKVALLKPLSSAISIGSGGPFGAEGPIIMTGGAVGSLFAQRFSLTDSERKTLLVAGASAGMSAIFASPMAAILLAVELLLFEWKPRSLVPVSVASLTAAALRPSLLGAGPIFPVASHIGWDGTALLVACLCGLIAGLFSTGTSTFLYKMEDAFHRLPIHWMWWCAIGGVCVGIGGYLQPRALGVGYDVIEDLLTGQLAMPIALSLLFVKSSIWVIALASGTSGGVLAPLLMMGAGLGVVEAHFISSPLQPLFPLISMAAVMGGMMRAPLTAVFFGFELTGNTDAIIPMLAATLAAYAMTVITMKRSILTEKIARRGFHIFREYSVDPLELTPVAEVMTRLEAQPSDKGPGVSSEETESMAVTIFTYESCREAAEKMALLGIGRLLVVAPEKPEQFVGFVTASDLLKPRLKHHQAEKKRERLTG